MSELINNSERKKELLKHMILQLHKGEAPDLVRKRLIELLKDVPYDMVVEVEQELIREGLPVEEVLKLCDIHTQVLDGHIDQSGAKEIPEGHPVDVFKKENRELLAVVDKLRQEFLQLAGLSEEYIPSWLLHIRAMFNQLSDVEKHYLRKENLLFPFLEKKGITGPPTVMWGKHDETRAYLKAAIEAISSGEKLTMDETSGMVQMLLIPATNAISDMVMKEEEILFPMTMDALTEEDWYQIHKQSLEIGYCLYSPEKDWKPEHLHEREEDEVNSGFIKLPTGYMTVNELVGIFSTLPVDLTFVDKDDKVKFFSEGGHRIFHRGKAIINRDVRMCHPPHSVGVVEQILADFKNGKETKASFWINMKGRFILIEYYAVRGENGEYLGTLEVTQDITGARSLEGEQRLLDYQSHPAIQ